jgi:hypothetical protein
MLIKDGGTTNTHPATLLSKVILILQLRKVALACWIILMSCLAWAQNQKEFIYLDGRAIATESSQNTCSYAIAPMNAAVAYSGGTGNISVIAGSGCAWTATTGDGWVTITGGNSGSGSGTVSYSISANGGGARAGSILIGGHPFTVTQDAYNYTPSPLLSAMMVPGYGIVLFWDLRVPYSSTDVIQVTRLTSTTYQTSQGYYIDNSVSYDPATTYVYRIQDISASGPYSNYDIATTIDFTDDPLTPGTVIKAQHILELRQAIDDIRAAAGLGAVTWTDSSLTGLNVKAVHINELRSNLNAALDVLQIARPIYTDDPIVAGQTVIKAVHIQEIRDAIK